MGNLLGFAQTPQWNPGSHLLQRFGFHARDHFGFDETGCNTGDADAVARQLLRPHHGICRHAGLGGRVVRLAHVAGTGYRGNVDDRALALKLNHLRGDLAGAEKYAGEVDVDHRLPLRQAHLRQFAVLEFYGEPIAENAGVVDQAVQATKVVADLAHHVANLLFVGDIAQVGACVTASVLASCHGFIQPILIKVDQRQAGALAGKVLAHCASEPLATASDNDDLVFQLHAYLLSMPADVGKRRPLTKPLC